MCESGVNTVGVNTLAAEPSSCPGSFASTRHPTNGRSGPASTLCPPGYDTAVQQLSSSAVGPLAPQTQAGQGRKKTRTAHVSSSCILSLLGAKQT